MSHCGIRSSSGNEYADTTTMRPRPIPLSDMGDLPAGWRILPENRLSVESCRLPSAPPIASGRLFPYKTAEVVIWADINVKCSDSSSMGIS